MEGKVQQEKRKQTKTTEQVLELEPETEQE